MAFEQRDVFVSLESGITFPLLACKLDSAESIKMEIEEFCGIPVGVQSLTFSNYNTIKLKRTAPVSMPRGNSESNRYRYVRELNRRPAVVVLPPNDEGHTMQKTLLTKARWHTLFTPSPMSQRKNFNFARSVRRTGSQGSLPRMEYQ